MKTNLFVFLFLSFTVLFFSQNRSTVKVVIDSSPSNVEFRLDDSDRTMVTPVSINMRRGQSYSLKFNVRGYSPKVYKFTAGESDYIKVVLDKVKSDNSTRKKPIPPPPPIPIPVPLPPPIPVPVPVPDPPRSISDAVINSIPQGARLTIDDSYNVYTTPVSVGFRNGQTYLLKFSMPGYKNMTIRYTGGSGNVNVSLEQDNFTVSFNSSPSGATVFINGNKYGQTPLSVVLNPGNYRVEASMPGYRNSAYDIVVDGDKRVNFNLIQDRYVILSLPVGASVWVNGNRDNNWNDDSSPGRRDRNEEFRDYVIYQSGSETGISVRIQYHGLLLERYIQFNNQKLTFSVDLR